jgi:hypothetical protein
VVRPCYGVLPPSVPDCWEFWSACQINGHMRGLAVAVLLALLLASADAQTSCTGNPTGIANSAWNPTCSGTLVGQNCTRFCNKGAYCAAGSCPGCALTSTGQQQRDDSHNLALCALIS